MAAGLAPEAEFRLRAFTEFDLLPELLELPRANWAAFLRDHVANLDHVEDGDLPEADDPHSHLAEDAWGLCRFLGWATDDGLTADGIALAEVPDGPSAVTERIRERVSRWEAGPDRIRVAPVINEAVQQVRDGGKPLSGVLPGLLLGEMAGLLEAARRGRAATTAALRGVGRNRGVVEADPPDPSELSEIGRKVVTANEANARALDGAKALAAGSGEAVTLTEARATATLLLRSGLFADVSPLGPVNCLAPPEASGPAPVLGRNGQVEAWGVGAGEAAMLMMCLHEHNFTTNEALVFPALGLKRGQMRGSDRKPLSVSEWRHTGKALSMEMLSSILLSAINGAEAVFAQWGTEGGRPVAFAPAGYSDIEATYPELSGGGRFEMVAAVSAKREETTGHFREQLDQALAHGRRLHDERGETVYALVINGGRIASDPALQAAHRKFVEENGLGAGDPVRVVPLSAIDLALAFDPFGRGMGPDGIRMAPERLAGALDGLHAALLGSAPSDGDWMLEALCAAAEGDSGLGLGDPVGPGSGGGPPPAPRPRRRSGRSPSP